MTARVDPDVERRILELWATNPNGYAVADAVGISNATVYRVLARNGVQVDREKSYRRRSRTTPDIDAEIVQRYAAGEGAGALAQEYGFACHLSVLKRVRDAGVEVRKPGPAFAKMPADVGAEIIRLRDEEGLSQEAIGRRVGIDQSRVSRWLLANGRRAWKQGRHPKYVGLPVRISGGYLVVKLEESDPLFVMADQANGYVRQHRYVMAQALGRPLTRNETVHHINGDPSDNRIENLQLRQGNHGKGVRFTCADCGSHNIQAAPL